MRVTLKPAIIADLLNAEIRIQNDVPGLEFINRLEPVTYNVDERIIREWFKDKYNDQSSAPINVEKSQMKFSGFLAQDVEAVAQSARPHLL